MTYAGRLLGLLFLAVVLGCASGCFGISQNPTSFPHWVPFGDVVETHPKPIGESYYSNYDPNAVDLAVEPAIITTQVGSQVVILATVRDEKGNPRRNRRVNWYVTGGHLIEVDESGVYNGRGGNRGNYAFSYTNYHEHRLSRGNTNKLDDIMLRPGQSWCVVSSPVEGDTHVQVVVPGIFNWDKRIKTALVRWVDATWEFPPRAAAKFGAQHEFVTRVARHTDRLPLGNYRVRYKILDGPPAILLPSRAQEDTVITDLSGLGKIRIAQLAPASGVNRVGVEIIRPPDPTTPSGTGVPIAAGETAIEWLAPDVKLNHAGPISAPLGTNIVYTTSATNSGRVDSEWIEMKLPIPDGLEFVSSQPPTTPSKGELVFPFGALGVGQTQTVQTTFKTLRAGQVRSIALLRTAERQTFFDQKEVSTTITVPQLTMDIAAPPTGLVDVPIKYEIRLSNPGTSDLDEILLTADFDQGLEHDKLRDFNKEKMRNYLEVKVAGLRAGESRSETLILVPRQIGALAVTVTASSAGLKQQAKHVVTVQQPKVSLRVQGPAQRYVGRPADWKIIVKNEGDLELSGVVVKDRLPAEQRFAVANRQGTFANGEVTWNLGTLKPREEVTLELTTDCLTAVPASEKNTLLVADGNLRTEKSARLEIQGIAALKMEVKDDNDPVEVGKNALYRVTITNTGSAPVKSLDVKATVPNLLKPVRADGPTRATTVGQSIAFDKVENLQPGAKVTFIFECQALKDGDARFRVEYTSDLNATPIFQEEPTRLITPFTPGGPIPEPPLPLPKG